MRKAFSLAILLVSFVLPASAAVIYKNFSQAANFSYYVPCANGGQGEMVHFTGYMLTRLAYVRTDAMINGYYHITPALTGVGEISGIVYRVLGTNQFTFKVLPFVTQTGVNVNNFAALGSDQTLFHFHENFNYTFIWNGDSIITHDNFMSFCVAP